MGQRHFQAMLEQAQREHERCDPIARAILLQVQPPHRHFPDNYNAAMQLARRAVRAREQFLERLIERVRSRRLLCYSRTARGRPVFGYDPDLLVEELRESQ